MRAQCLHSAASRLRRASAAVPAGSLCSVTPTRGVPRAPGKGHIWRKGQWGQEEKNSLVTSLLYDHLIMPGLGSFE